MKKIVLVVAAMALLVSISAAQVPASNHVVLVVEENHSYSSVIGSASMPYLNSLASKYGLATQYFANTHPSIGNYLEMTTGQVLTNDDTQTPASFPVSDDNIVRQLLTAGKTWKSYAEDLPYAGYTGGDTGNYAVRHNPFAYFADVQNSRAQRVNLVPFSQFATDLANDQLPNFSYIVPNLNNDAHNGTLQQADTWLQQNIAPLLADAAFQQDGLLIITFDESADTDTAHGGGQVATVVVGPKAKLGYKSNTLYQHQNLLRTVLTVLGVTSFPGDAASATPMSDFFASTAVTQTSATASGVTITSPANGATVSSPVQFVASAVSSNSSYPITAMRIYVDSTSMYTVNATSLNTTLALAAGGHTVTIVAWDSSGQSYTKSLSISVGAANGTGTTAVAGVTITSPAAGATVTSPTQFVASAASSNSTYPITAMRIYVDNSSVYTVNAASLNTSLSLASGGHSVTVVAWDASGQAYTKSLSITVGSASPGAVTITSPVNGSTVSSSVQFQASATANSGSTITAMSVYVDNVSMYGVNASSLNTSINLASGVHSVVVQAWDNTGAVYKSAETITVAATTAGTLAATPNALSFGTVNVGSSASQTVTLTAGTAAVTVSQANVSGAGFVLSGLTLPATIAAGQSFSFNVKFAPAAAGSASGSVSLVSNATNTPATIALSGTGAAVATVHSVMLNWTASTSAGVTGYNVYRAAQSGGAYTKTTTAPVSATSYTDAAVASGATYYYVVTAVNASAQESGYSAQVSATIP